MAIFLDEILGQPDTLRLFVGQYKSNFRHLINQVPFPRDLILTGMGASYHAAWAMSFYYQSLGLCAQAVEAVDLSRSHSPKTKDYQDIVYVSQSGSSPEVHPILSQLNTTGKIIGITNNADSPLAKNANCFFPLLVEEEETVATKTYINTLACLWLLGRHWVDQLVTDDFLILDRIADEMQTILDRESEIINCWFKTFSSTPTLIFTGAGPQAATSRQAAQTVAEWAKVPVIGISTGALRHGYVEIVGPDCGVVVFVSPGQTYSNSLSLAHRLHGYGAKVLVVLNGRSCTMDELINNQLPYDEYLSPLLDILPAQLYADALAKQQGIEPGFRHLTKVVKD